MNTVVLVYLIGTYGDPDTLESVCESEEVANEYIGIKKKYGPVLSYRKEEWKLQTFQSNEIISKIELRDKQIGGK